MDLRSPSKRKVALVTGASTGIGRALAIRFAREGYRILLVGRNIIALEETSRLIRLEKGESEVLMTDLGDSQSVDDLIAKVRIEEKRIDLLVNVAAIWHGDDEVYANKNLEEFSQEVILKTLMVGVTSPLLLVHGLIKIMPRGSTILSISGTFENRGAGWLPYFVSKRAIEDFTVGLAQELGKKGITVNCISPSDTNTEAYRKFFPQFAKDALSPKEIADFAVSFLKGKDSELSGKIFVMKKGKSPYEGFHS